MGQALARQSSFDISAWVERLEGMRRQMEEAQSVQECLDVSNSAEAIRVLFQQAGACQKDQNAIGEIKVRAERKAGQLLDKTPMAKAGRPPKNQSQPVRDFPTLAEQQIHPMVSSRCQTIATIPAPAFEKEMDFLREKPRPAVSSEHFIRLGKKLKASEKRAEIIALAPKVDSNVRVGDFRSVLCDLPDRSVSLIFTDPPYDNKSVPLYRDLGELAARVLSEDGSLVCYAGQHALPEVFAHMQGCGLYYQWAFAVRHSGGHRRMHGFKVRVAWKPLLWFVKGRYDGEYLLDLLDSEPGDKDHHEWAQGCAEAAYLIKHLCPEGGLVVDPMCGSGTALRAAKELGRRFLGVEIDEEKAGVASGLLSKE